LGQKKSSLQAGAEYVLALALLSALEWLPLSFANALARAATRILDLAMPKLRRVAMINLAFAFPDLDFAKRTSIVDGTFRTLARLLVAFARFPRFCETNIGDWIGYEGLEHYRAAKAAGSGVLIATAHLGNWELSAFAHALMTESMNVMVRPLDNSLIDALVEKRRMLSGNRLILKKDGARAVLKALKQNEAVGILIDQNTASSEGVFIDFFGKPACAGLAFVKLAQHSGAAVIPGFAFWDEKARHYVLRFYPRIEMTGDELADTKRIHTFIEGEIRKYPDQWMWIHRRWKTRPPGEPDLY
jgi:KDO2-lipid IV(A) lauroyltransferase